ncbi:Scr1 family TA system antitoxin-like transcriptional regulator [Kitasatospora sp. NPDC050543]|uniref:Scr1 family TA system antitoxin-like transcriptional regulator n=1 Tax=Kitasatospora sp. NPDC050543 TaxID=3364054 RepID=UPI0037BDD2AC
MARRKPAQGATSSATAIWGEELQELRKAAGLTQAQLAERIHVDQSWVSLMENGRAVLTRRLATDCDTALSTGNLLERSYRYVERDIADHHPDWFRQFVEIELQAEQVWELAAVRVSGLLQTPEYAEALYRDYDPYADETSIAERVAARMTRQERLHGPARLHLQVLLDEGALHRSVGGAEVMYRQLDHLLHISRLPNVTLQVLPLSGGQSDDVSSIVLRLPSGQEWLYSESLTRGHLISDESELRTHRRRYDRIRSNALTVDDSARLIRTIMEGVINMRATVDLAKASWVKSSYSGGNGGACVEWAPAIAARGIVPVRDSKDPQGPTLLFPRAAWTDFVTAAADGEFDLV